MSTEVEGPTPGDDVIALLVMRPVHMIADPAITGSQLDKCTKCEREVWVSQSGWQQREAWASRGGTTELHCCCCIGMHSVEEMRDIVAGNRDFEINGEVAQYHVHDFASGECNCGMKPDLITTDTNETVRRIRDEEASKRNFDPDNPQDL
jgi:hypothetical protein